MHPLLLTYLTSFSSVSNTSINLLHLKHQLIVINICENYHQPDNSWAPNLDMFIWRLGAFPDRLKNIYFTFVYLLRYSLTISLPFIFFILTFTLQSCQKSIRFSVYLRLLHRAPRRRQASTVSRPRAPLFESGLFGDFRRNHPFPRRAGILLFLSSP